MCGAHEVQGFQLVRMHKSYILADTIGNNYRSVLNSLVPRPLLLHGKESGDIRWVIVDTWADWKVKESHANVFMLSPRMGKHVRMFIWSSRHQGGKTTTDSISTTVSADKIMLITLRPAHTPEKSFMMQIRISVSHRSRMMSMHTYGENQNSAI